MLLEPVPGDAVGIRAVADAVESTGRRLADAAATLGRMRDGAVWDGPAGEAFGARISLAPSVLDSAARRFLGAAAPMRAYADVFEHEQAVAQRAVLVHREAWEVYDHLEDRAAVLTASGLDEASPAVLTIRQAQQEEVAVAVRAEAAHGAALEVLAAADARCGTVLAGLARDAIADSALYRGLRTASGVGHGVGYLASAPSRLFPGAVAAGTVGEAVGTLSDGVLLVGYDEGSWCDLGVGAAAYTLGFAGQSARNGAKARTVLRADGTVATWAAAADRRLVEGALVTARQRLAEARTRLRAVPERGTPSALVGGPPPAPPGSALGRLRGQVRGAVHAKVVEGITELRTVTAGGRTTVRMYAGGVALAGASKALPHVAPGDAGPTPRPPVTLSGREVADTRRSTP
jgi:hypothetical protein